MNRRKARNPLTLSQGTMTPAGAGVQPDGSVLTDSTPLVWQTAELTLQVDGLPSDQVYLAWIEPVGPSIETVVIHPGSHATVWWFHATSYVFDWVQELVDAGRTVVSLIYLHGWDQQNRTGGVGVGQIGSAANGLTVMEYIRNNLCPSGIMRYLGSSAGGSLGCYLCGSYGYSRHLRKLICSSSPPHAAQDLGCNGPSRFWYNAEVTSDPEWDQADAVDDAYKLGPPGPMALRDNTQDPGWYVNSCDTGAHTLVWDNLEEIVFVFGNNDPTCAPPHSKVMIQNLELAGMGPKISVRCAPKASHGIQGNQLGRKYLKDAILLDRMPPGPRKVSATVFGGVNTLTPDFNDPDMSTKAGNLLLIPGRIGTTSQLSDITVPAGWNLEGFNMTNRAIWCLYKIADGTEESETINFAVTQNCGAYLLEVEGLTNPVLDWVYTQAQLAGNPYTIGPTTNPALANSFNLAIIGMSGGNAQGTWDGGFWELVNLTDDGVAATTAFYVPDADGVLTTTESFSASETAAGMILSFRST